MALWVVCPSLQVSVDVPDQKGRLAILKVHSKNKKLADEVDLSQIAMRTPGFSGADLANLLNEVCLVPDCGLPNRASVATFRTSLPHCTPGSRKKGC